MPLGNGFEERRAECRCQRERQEARKQDRDDHREAELLVDDTDGAREERHGHENGGQHERDADDRACDLTHRLLCRLTRRQPLLGHDAFDVLNHDDSIVHQNADGEHHGEHGQHIDREACSKHDRARAEQRDGHDDGGNDRVAEALQEKKHHEEDENHRFHQRVHHLLDGYPHEGRSVVGNGILDARRKEAGELSHLCVDRVRCRERISGRRELDADRGRRLTVEARREGVAFAADFDPRDITEAYRRAVRIGAQHDRSELLRRGELALDEDRCGDLLCYRVGLRADGAGCNLSVLRADRREDVVRCQTQAQHLVGIDPDAHGPLRSKKRCATDARNAADLAHDIAVEIISEADSVDVAIGRSQRDDEKKTRAGLFDAQTLLRDGLRQPRLDAANAVLHLDLCLTDPRAGGECRGELDAAGRVRCRFVIKQARNAVEFFFDRARHTLVHVLGRCAREICLHRDLWRRHCRVLRDRQKRNGDRACDHDEDGDHPSENRAIDEKAWHGSGLLAC